MNKKIRVVVVEDHAIVREGLVSLMRGEPDLEVVAAHATGEDAIAAVLQDAPDIILLDIRLPGMDGLSTLTALRARRPETRVLMLTSQQGDESIYRALKSGAVGYLLKRQPSEDLLKAIRDTHAGGTAMANEVSVALAQRMSGEEVTARERAILRNIAQGLSNKDIAEHLGVSPNTIRNQIAALMGKLGAVDRTQAVTIALQRGIIDLG
ncbi:MAG: response regulator transcription factor [Deltaproteobacteria bacterium]|nr:response regulator transcription factor [Deltaproteobacteria bacterium]